ncbi:MAG: hypothetical protein ACKO7R_15480 [Pseudanabaena sp.]
MTHSPHRSRDRSATNTRSPDAFRDYFATLAEPADQHNLNFWQTLSVDYFATGGQPCPKIQRALENSDRFLACQIEDVWQSGQRIISPQKYLVNDHSSPFDAKAIEQLFTRSLLIQKSGITFEDAGDKVWTMQLQQKSYQVTFDPDIFDEHPSLRLMTFGDPLFETILFTALEV